MIVHLIPFLLTNVFGARIVTVGLIEGVAETTASILKLVSGRLSDRWGQRKWLTVFGYGLSTIAKPFLNVAQSWTGVLTVRFAERVGKGIRTAPRDALVADSILPEQRGFAFGLHRAGDTAGAALGLLVALGVVWWRQGEQMTLGLPTFRTLVWLSLIPAVLTVILLVVGIEEPRKYTKKELPPLTWRGINIPFRRFLIIIMLFTLGNSSDAFLLLRAQERGFSVLGVMGLLALFNVVYAGISAPAGSLSDRFGRKKLLVVGWLVYAGIYLGFALAQTKWQVGILYITYGLYHGLSIGSTKAFVADLVPTDQRGTAYGLYNAAVGIIALPASLIAGLLWQGVGNWAGFGAYAPFLFGAILALVSVTILITWLPSADDMATNN
jgi:MFS family permease